ncbi:hypothetical protein CR513_39929, partial [Mucuna pruriens]
MSQVWKVHFGVFLNEQGVCLKCHTLGHLSRDCPSLKKEGVPNPPPLTKERVFILSGEEAKEVDNLIQLSVSTPAKDKIITSHFSKSIFVLLLSSKVYSKLNLPIILVSEFTNIFPKEVTTLPTEKEVEFSITLVPKKNPSL